MIRLLEDELEPSLEHDSKGIISMANSGPNTNASQFFITYSKQMHLNGIYTIFGKIIDGFETLELMENESVGKNNRPIKDIKILSVTIHSNPIAEKEANY